MKAKTVKTCNSTEPQYQDYLNLIRREAWKRIRYNPLLDYDELIGQGSLAFSRAVETWDPTKGKFSTHLVWQCRNFMGRTQGCQNYPEESVSLDDPEPLQLADEQPGPFEQVKLRAGLSGLSSEAMEVVRLILEVPWELADWTIRWVRISQGSIKLYLRGLGWRHNAIDRAFAEIRAMLDGL